MAKGKQQKKPKAPVSALGLAPSPTKAVPKKQLEVLGDEGWNQRLIIRFDQVDYEGPWSITAASRADLVRIFKAVADFESMTVAEVFNGGHPGMDYSTGDLPKKEATDRLEALALDDQDTISRLRLSGEARLYGFRRGRFFHVLWWDPHHQIWPSTLKNT